MMWWYEKWFISQVRSSCWSFILHLFFGDYICRFSERVKPLDLLVSNTVMIAF